MLSRCCLDGLHICSVNGYDFFMCDKCENECDIINHSSSMDCINDTGFQTEIENVAIGT